MRKQAPVIRVPKILKTTPVQAGKMEVIVKNGTKFVALALTMFPDHDRNLVAMVHEFLRQYKPDVLLLMGGIIHDDSFLELAPKRQGERHRIVVHQNALAPELKEVIEKEKIWENRVDRWGGKCGEFVLSFAQAADAELTLYVPATWPLIPREFDAIKELYYVQELLANFRKRHPQPSDSEVRKILSSAQNNSSSDFRRLLHIKDKSVHILPFGAIVEVKERDAEKGMLFLPNSQRRRNAFTAAHTYLEQYGQSIAISMDGKLSSSYPTYPGTSFPTRRRYLEAHEMGKLYDDARMGELQAGEYHRVADGFLVGTVIEGMTTARTVPFLRGKDGCRCLVYDDICLKESKPGALAKTKRVVVR